MRSSARTPIWLSALALVTAAGCAGRPRTGGPPAVELILPDFRATPPTSAPVAPTTLTGFTDQEVYGRLSPSGEMVVYSSDPEDDFDLWMRSLRTGELTKITRHPAMDTMPTWSPDGEKIVFVSMRDDVKGDLYLWNGDLDEERDNAEQLTGRTLGELFPVFSPDGRFVYYAQGPEGKYRIARLDLSRVEDKKDRDDPVAETVVTDWGFSHPAVSPDGTLLAAARFRPGEPSQIAIVPIENPAGAPKYGKPRIVTSGVYAKGFPTFSPDGKTLYFMVFHHGAPMQTPNGDAEGSIWSMPAEGLTTASPAELMAQARQLTSDRAVSVLGQAHASGLVYTGLNGTNLDIYLMPAEGVLPHTGTVAEQIALADSYEDVYGKAFALRGLARFPPTPESQRGLYEALELYSDAGEFEKAAEIGEVLAAQTEGGPLTDVGRCRAASAYAEATKAREAETGVYFEEDAARAALDRVKAAGEAARSPEGKAQCRVQEGEVHLLAGDWQAAAADFRAVLAGGDATPAQSAAAYLGLGRVLGRLPGGGEAGAEYFLGAWDRWPGETRALARASNEALRNVAAASPEPALEIETLRFLIDRHAKKSAFAAKAQFRMGELYAASGQSALAAQAMETLLDRWPSAQPEATRAGFKAGRYAAALAAELRAQGRFNEASAYYDRALASYASVMKAHPPLNPLHEEARRHTVALSLQRAFQAEQDGDAEKAHGLYTRLLQFEPDAIAALRKVIQHDLNQGVPPPATDGMDAASVKKRRDEIKDTLEANWNALRVQFEDRLEEDEGDFAAMYGLGYLWTYDPDFRVKSLDEAEEYLEAASYLRPDSPFPHMTLGWVNLMREQYFDKVNDAYVITALDHYGVADGLNVRGIDLQTEADLLVSHGNAWAALGNGWTYAYEKYQAREALVALGAGFTHPEQKAMFYFNYAQAAYMTDRFREAEDHYQTARAIVHARAATVDPILADGYREMDAQIVAHLALVNHFMGDYEGSNRYFDQTIKLYSTRHKTRLLAAMTRSVAYNLILMGEYGQAMAKLDEAKALYEQHGSVTSVESTRIALTPEGSLFYGGFPGDTEKHVQTALRDLIYRDNHALWYASQAAAEQLDQRRDIYKENENPDFARALWILKGRVANSALLAGDRRAFAKSLDQIFDEAVELQWDDSKAEGEEFQGQPELFGFMATAMVNRTEQMLKDRAEGLPQAEGELAALADRLRRMEDWRQRLEVTDGRDLIADEELRMKYLNATALLFMEYGREQAKEGGADGKKGTGWGTYSLSGKFDAWMRQASYFSDAAGLLLQAVARSAPEPSPKARPAPDTRKTFVADRLHWHLLSLVNLADVASYFSPPDGVALDRGMAYLEQGWKICHVEEALDRNTKRAEAAAAAAKAAAASPPDDSADPPADETEAPAPPTAPPSLGEIEETPIPVKLDLGDACPILDMEIASRRRDAEAAFQIVQRLPQAPFLGEGYRTHGQVTRRRLFQRAMEVAVQAGQLDRLPALADMEDRRLVADELWSFGFKSPSAPLEAALEPLRQWADFYRRAWANQTVEVKGAEQHETAMAAMARARDVHLWNDLYSKLGRQSRAVQELLIGAQPWRPDDTAAALGDDAVLISAIPVGQEVYFFARRKGAGEAGLSLTQARAPGTLTAIRSAAAWGEQNFDAVLPLLPKAMMSWGQGAHTLYLDLLRLGPEFPAEALAERLAPKAVRVHLAGASELDAAYQVRNLYTAEPMILASDTLEGGALSRTDAEATLRGTEGWEVLEEEKLGLTKASGHMRQAGLQIWTLPLKVEEDSVANIRLGLKGPVPGLEDYRFPDRLGDRLQASFVAALAVEPGLREREATVLLTRYLHAVGVPSVALAPPKMDRVAVGAWIGELVPRLGKARAAEVLARSPGPVAILPLAKGESDEDPKGRDVERKARVRLFGWAGLAPSDAQAAASSAESMYTAGKAAWDIGQYRAVAANFEPVLALWQAAGETDTPRVLEVQTLLAQAHVQLGDTRSAVLLQLDTVDKLDRTAAPAAKRIAAWLHVPEWQAAGGRHDDALESLGKLMARLAKDLQGADGLQRAELLGLQAEAQGLQGRAYAGKGMHAEAVAAFEAAAEGAQQAMEGGANAGAEKRRIAINSAQAARTARERLADSSRAKRALNRAIEAMPKVDAADFKAREIAYAESVRRLADSETQEGSEVDWGARVHALREELAPLREDAKAKGFVLRELSYVKLAHADAAGAAVDAAEAVELASPLADQTLAHGCRLALAAAELELGDAPESLAVAEAGLKASRLAPAWHARFAIAQARALDRLGRADEARSTLIAAAAEAREARDDDVYTSALRTLADVEMYAGAFSKAATQFRAAEISDRERGDKVRIADDLVNTGKILRLMGRNDEALARLKEARDMAREVEAWEVLVRVGVLMGRAHLAMNAPDAALAAFQDGLAAEKRLSLPGTKWKLLLGQSLALMALNRGAEAEPSLDEAAAAVELLPSKPPRAFGSARVDFEFRDVFDALVALNLERGRPEAAFDAAERARARAFVDMTARSAGVFQRAKVEIARYTKALSVVRQAVAELAAAPAEERDAAEKAVVAARAAAETAKRALAAVDPQFPAFFAVDSQPFSALRAHIPAGASLLAYYTAPWGTVAFVADAKGVQATRIEATADVLATEIRGYRRHVTSFDDVTVDAGRLYDVLVKPVADTLAPRVFVVPDGPLNLLPFAALWTGKTWAVERWTLASLPSANHLRMLKAVGTPSARAAVAFNWAGMGPESEPKAGTKRYFKRLETWRGFRATWPHLPFTEKETQAFKETFPQATVYAGPAASRQNFLDRAGGADVLEIATHAVFVPDNPMLSYLQFGGLRDGEAFPAFNDERVTVYDVLGMTLDADVATLSACETGLAEPETGDGLMGMHRAFLAAGARTVVSSLWRVSDLTTGVLMKNFHRNLKGRDPATALREAQLKVLKYFPHPAYWAGFRLDGLTK